MTHVSLADAADAAVKPLELAVVLPTLNEKDNVAPMVARLEQALGPSGWEAVFVDDSSADGTAEGVENTAPGLVQDLFGKLRVIHGQRVAGKLMGDAGSVREIQLLPRQVSLQRHA